MLVRRLLVVVPVLVVGCSATPRSFIKQRQRLQCKYIRDCEPDDWDDHGYRTVGDCLDDRLSEREIDNFVDRCHDYHADEASECLNGHRAIHRECDGRAATPSEERACGRVCDDDFDDDDFP